MVGWPINVLTLFYRAGRYVIRTRLIPSSVAVSLRDLPRMFGDIVRSAYWCQPIHQQYSEQACLLPVCLPGQDTISVSMLSWCIDYLISFISWLRSSLLSVAYEWHEWL